MGIGLLAGGSSLAAEAASVRPEPFAADSPIWDGPQWVRSDRAGNVFILRGDRFEAYPLTKAGELGKPQRFEANPEALGVMLDAALSRGGDKWLVYTGDSVRLFEGGKEKVLPIPSWKPWSVGFLRDSPVLAVMPRPMPSAMQNLAKLGSVPWMLVPHNDRWSPLVEHKDLSAEAAWRDRARMNEWVSKLAVYMAEDAAGKLWVANQYAYRVQQLSPTGRVLLRITVNGGKVRQKVESRSIQVKIHGDHANPSDATKNPQTERGTFHSFTAEPVILDLTEGRDGRMYFLVRAEEGVALDRYDPVRSIVERLDLHLKTEGRVTIASGRQGLYLAARNGRHGRWRISWNVLDEAPWLEVPDAEIDGTAASE